MFSTTTFRAKLVHFLFQKIFSYLQFNVGLSTASQFCDILMPYSLQHTDIMAGLPISNLSIITEMFIKVVKCFLDISLQVKCFTKNPKISYGHLRNFGLVN